jgi:hypothetical protein
MTFDYKGHTVDVRVSRLAHGSGFAVETSYSRDAGDALVMKSVWVDKNFETEAEAQDAGAFAGTAAIDGVVAGV